MSDNLEDLLEDLASVETKKVSLEDSAQHVRKIPPTDIRFKLRKNGDILTYELFKNICEKKGMEPRKVVLNFIEEWVIAEGSEIYGSKEITRRMEEIASA